jgi:hypothetical protein
LLCSRRPAGAHDRAIRREPPPPTTWFCEARERFRWPAAAAKEAAVTVSDFDGPNHYDFVIVIAPSPWPEQTNCKSARGPDWLDPVGRPDEIGSSDTRAWRRPADERTSRAAHRSVWPTTALSRIPRRSDAAGRVFSFWAGKSSSRSYYSVHFKSPSGEKSLAGRATNEMIYIVHFGSRRAARELSLDN